MTTNDYTKKDDSRGNSLSSGDPNLKTNQENTSTEANSSENTGESAPQSGENIVNEQEQNKTVNLEEFIENSPQNRLGDDETR